MKKKKKYVLINEHKKRWDCKIPYQIDPRCTGSLRRKYDKNFIDKWTPRFSAITGDTIGNNYEYVLVALCAYMTVSSKKESPLPELEIKVLEKKIELVDKPEEKHIHTANRYILEGIVGHKVSREVDISVLDSNYHHIIFRKPNKTILRSMDDNKIITDSYCITNKKDAVIMKLIGKNNYYDIEEYYKICSEVSKYI